jgi:hypothetical protein
VRAMGTSPGKVEGALQGETKERWLLLCEQAAVEEDPERLLELVKEINRILEEKEKRLTGKDRSANSTSV